MLTFMWAALVAAIAGLTAVCRPGPVVRVPSWFDLQPYLRESKKRRGRAQRRRR